MMGKRHALSGVALGVTTLTVADAVGANPVLWVVAAVGGAMLPDMDTSGAYAARVWGPLTRAAGGALGRFAGGHREATHDIVAAPLVVAAVGSLALLWWPAAVLLTGFVLAVALRMTLAGRLPALRQPLPNALVSLGVAYTVVTSGTPLWWGPLVVAAGVIVHILCDAVTTEGAPLPVKWIWDPGARRVQWGPRLFSTGSPAEQACGVLFAVLIVWALVGYPLPG